MLVIFFNLVPQHCCHLPFCTSPSYSRVLKYDDEELPQDFIYVTENVEGEGVQFNRAPGKFKTYSNLQHVAFPHFSIFGLLDSQI